MQGRATTSGKYQEKYARQSTSLPQSCWQQRSPHGEIDQGIDIAIAPHNAACHAAVDNKPAAFLPCIDLQVRHDTVCGNSSSSGSARVAFLNGLNCQHGGPLQRALPSILSPYFDRWDHTILTGNDQAMCQLEFMTWRAALVPARSTQQNTGDPHRSRRLAAPESPVRLCWICRTIIMMKVAACMSISQLRMMSL